MPQRATIERICIECSGRFMAQPRDVERGRAKFCSPQCSGRAGGRVCTARNPQTGTFNFNYRHGQSHKASRYTSVWQLRNPEKKRAHRLVAEAIARGHLVKPSACEACGREIRLDAHHDDYAKPLDVRWFCRKCHVAHHKAGQGAGSLAALASGSAG